MIKNDFIIDSLVVKGKNKSTTQNVDKKQSLLFPDDTIYINFFSFSSGKYQSLSLFKHTQQKSLDSLYRFLQKTKIRIKSKIDFYQVDFYEILKKITKMDRKSLRSFSQDQMNYSKFLKNEKKFEKKLEDYQSLLKNNQTHTPKRKEGSQNGYSLNRIDYQNTACSFPFEHFDYEFLVQSKETRFSVLISSEVKTRFMKVIKSIKRTPILNSPKFASILSILKVDCEFLNDIESSLYCTLDIIGKYPEYIFIKDSQQNNTHFQAKTSMSLKNTFKLNDKTFISPRQITILLSILANIDIRDFLQNVHGIVWYFELFDKKKKEHDTLDYNFNPRISKFEHYKENSEIGRFIRLKILINRICREKKMDVLRVFDFNFEYLKHLLIKLSPKFAVCLDEKLQVVLRVYRRYFFNFLLGLMMSDKIHFIHKFCLVVLLNSKCYF